MPTDVATETRVNNIKPAMDHLALDIADIIIEGKEEVPTGMSLALQALALYNLDDAGLAVVIDQEEDGGFAVVIDQEDGGLSVVIDQEDGGLSVVIDQEDDDDEEEGG